jgi:hypothetical protein
LKLAQDRAVAMNQEFQSSIVNRKSAMQLSWRFSMKAKALFAFGLLLLPAALRSADSGYHVTKKDKIGGEGF